MRNLQALKTKRGVELSMNAIIVGVMALIVLVVLAFVFTGKIRAASEATQNAVREYQGEKCSIPGTARACRSVGVCKSIGGLDYGKLDCAVGICCSK